MEQETAKQEVKQYEYAHLVCACGKCGSKYVLQKDVKGGVHINLPTASNAEIVLVCKECKNTMALFYIESDGSSLPKEDSNVDQTEINIEENKGIVAVDSDITVEPKMEIVE